MKKLHPVILLLVFLPGLNSTSPSACFAIEKDSLKRIKENFRNPPVDCWPHTRWWWPGNPVSRAEITWQLEQMRAKGIRGVEQITMSPVYSKGNIEYLSDEFLEMIRHTVQEAKRLGMEVSFNFGGPGWIIGGEWVPEADRSKDMLPTFIDLMGPQTFHGPLPDKLTKTKRSWENYQPYLSGKEKLLAVVAGKVIDGRIDERTLTVLSAQVVNKILEWQVPAGHWRLMAFWLAPNGHANAVDHFHKAAMQRYCDYLGGKFLRAVGPEFGKTVDSFFCDSFELPNLASGIYWSNDLLKEFQILKGYDLTPYLPAIWWEVGKISPKIRYDVNEFLHQVGLKAFFKTFLDWCAAHGIQGRIQTYGFTTDNIEAAGVTHIPEMEITPGEKDAADWFDTRIGPKKYVASGAHIYGRPVVSVEAYTFIHWERYRASLEELKIASDGFLRAGATKFYNHGYSFSPERDVAPSRTMPWAPQIHPTNVWWPYYPLLTEYLARCSYLLRQGDFAPDIAIYSPLANQWTLDVLNPRKWTREFDWGDLGFLLISNGYDFDLLNDDALQNIARFEDGMIKIRKMEYKILLLPNIRALPLKTLERIRQFVLVGGVVIALDRVPQFSTGLVNYEKNDQQVQDIVNELFKEPHGRDGVGVIHLGKGHSYFINNVIDRKIWWDQRSSMLDPFLNTIRRHLSPDFGIDFATEGIRKNEGLTFLHRRMANADLYFVTNIQEQTSTIPVTFRVKNRKVWKWNPYNGEISRIYHYQETKRGIQVPLRLTPYASTFLLFEKGSELPHVVRTDFEKIELMNEHEVVAITNANGSFQTLIQTSEQLINKTVEIRDLPAPFNITGNWKLTLEGQNFSKIELTITTLDSWIENPKTQHFSGTGIYEIEFDLPAQYLTEDYRLILDLGKVGNIAEVFINEIPVGIVWIRGQTLDITSAIQTGTNHLRILVTNTLINRVSAFKTAPPVPEELVAHFGKDTTAFSARNQPEFGFEPLPASGLLGPVKILVTRNIHLLF